MSAPRRPVVGLVVFACMLAACLAERPATPDVAPLCPKSCAILRELECPEGLDPKCEPKCERVAGLGYVWTTDRSGPACVVHATSREQARACNVRCAP